MSLSRSGIDYLTHVWNPVAGCNNNCSWCYGRNRWAPRMKHLCKLCGDYVPHIHTERFGDVTPGQKPKVIGLGFFTDLFGPHQWQGRFDSWDLPFQRAEVVLQHVKSHVWGCPQHQFVTLTKFPENIPRGSAWPDNWHIGVSCTTQPEVEERVPALIDSGVPHPILSLEPLLARVDVGVDIAFDFFDSEFAHAPAVTQLEWIIAGGLTGCGKSPTQIEWVEDIAIACEEAGVPLYVKRNAPQPSDDGSTQSWLPWPREAPEPIAAILRQH